MQVAVPRSAKLRLGLRGQVVLALGMICALLAIVAGIAMLSIARIQQIASRTVEVESRLNRIANDVVIYTQLCRRFEKEVFLNVDEPAGRGVYLSQWQTSYHSLEQAIDEFSRAAATDEDRRLASAWLTQGANYRAAFLKIRDAIIHSGITRPQDANDALRPYRDDIQALTDTALSTAQHKALKVQQAEATLLETTTRSSWLVLLISAIALAAALAWSVLFPARLMRPIDALRAAVGRLAGGDLSARVGLTRADELGALARGFDQMAATIQQRNCELEAQRAQAEAARAEAEHARFEISAQLATIEEQRTVIREMSVPIMPLDAATLVMPLVGALDSERIRLVQEQALQAIERSSARHLILDISAVPIVDTQVAQGLLRVVQAARLLGAEVVLVGIRPEVAQAVVGLGIQLDTMVTRSSLQSGIGYVQRRN
jgi:anti-anti-sigma regulatory factor/HAMP domain-containing protein